MRVTQTMLSNNMLRNLMKSQAQMDKYFTQIYTGKKISRPSQDPVIAMKGMFYRTQVAEVEQYRRNLGEVHNWMENTDAALDKATQVMHRLSELAVQASNDTNGEQERESIKKEVLQLKEHLIEIVNTNVNGKYIFNGNKTNEKPINVLVNNDGDLIDEDGNLISAGEFPVLTNPNSGSVMIEVSKGTELQVNLDASELFNKDFFEVINTFISNLENGTDIDQSIGQLNEKMAEIVDARAELGARMNRVELIETRLAEQEVIAKRIMSDNEDVHFEEAITNLITQESLHRAALSAGARIIQPTLVDFLR